MKTDTTPGRILGIDPRYEFVGTPATGKQMPDTFLSGYRAGIEDAARLVERNILYNGYGESQPYLKPTHSTRIDKGRMCYAAAIRKLGTPS
jgi:hypothetical protein